MEKLNLLRTALVTGGSRRIGRAVVEDLAAHGYAVAIHANESDDEASALAAELGRKGSTVTAVTADLTRMDAVDSMLQRAEAEVGPIGVLVNNASIFSDDSATAFNEDLFDRHFAVHLKAPLRLAEHMHARLPVGVEGLIVNMIDQRVWALTPRFFSYTLSKSALWTATQTLAQALAPRIRVNAIGPGPTLANERQDAEAFRRQSEAVLLKRGPDLAEFGRTIRYMHETRSMTGQMIALDGGQHLAWETPDVADIDE